MDTKCSELIQEIVRYFGVLFAPTSLIPILLEHSSLSKDVHEAKRFHFSNTIYQCSSEQASARASMLNLHDSVGKTDTRYSLCTGGSS